VAAAITGDEQPLQSLPFRDTRSLDEKTPEATLDRVRYWLFSPQQPPAARRSTFAFLGAGENLECVEIARRIRTLAEQGTHFDRVAILLRNVEQYQPLVRGASTPLRFRLISARSGSSRSGGRAFLALLACAGEDARPRVFADIFILGQVPHVDTNGRASGTGLAVDAARRRDSGEISSAAPGLEMISQRRLKNPRLSFDRLGKTAGGMPR